MSNLVLFQSRITDESSPAYKSYIKLYEDNIIDNPIIFTDYCSIRTDSNISIFNIYFLRQHFFDCIILLDFQDIDYLVNLQNHQCIVIYNSLFHDVSKLDSKKYIAVDIESNISQTIQDLLNEKV